MDKIKILTYAVIALLVLNLATIGFVASKPGDRHRPEPREIIIEKLHFDETQQKEYEQLIDWHRGQIKKLDEKIRETKKELYAQLVKNELETKTKDSLITTIAVYQKQIETTHFKHFQDIKKLCRKDQIQSYIDLTAELSQLFSPKPPKRD
jgi:predicted nucleic acid-binding protein